MNRFFLDKRNDIQIKKDKIKEILKRNIKSRFEKHLSYWPKIEMDVLNIISGSLIYKEFLKRKYLPPVNRLLDLRNILVEKREDDVINPPDFYNREIATVDYLLKFHNHLKKIV